MTGNQKSSLMSLCPLGCNASKRFCTNWGSHLALCTLCSLSFEHTPLHSVVLQEILKIFFLNKNQFLPNLTCTLQWLFLVADLLDQANWRHTATVLWHWMQLADVWNVFWWGKHWFWSHQLSVLNEKDQICKKMKKRDSKQVSSAWPWDSKDTF